VEPRSKEVEKVNTPKLADSSFLVSVTTLNRELLALVNTTKLQISVLKQKFPFSKDATASAKRLPQLVLESMITNAAPQLSKLDQFNVTSATKPAVKIWTSIPMEDLAPSKNTGTLVTTLVLILLE
jgi:hypothetical protein